MFKWKEKLNFECIFNCEWMQLIERYVTKKSFFSWYEWTLMHFSWEYINHDVLKKERFKLDMGILHCESDAYPCEDKKWSITFTVGLIGFVIIFEIDRMRPL